LCSIEIQTTLACDISWNEVTFINQFQFAYIRTWKFATYHAKFYYLKSSSWIRNPM
jgi:hypothetical protein